jgi:WD40 repeat protein
VARVWRVDGMDRESPVVLAHPLAIPAAEPSASASFSPDGTRVVTGALDGTVRVWMADGSDRDRPLLLEGHTTEISAASFSPGETRVVAGGTDGTLRLWMADGSNRDEPDLLRGHETGITAASFGPHGAQVLAGAGDGTTRIWVIDGPKKGQTVVLESPAKVDLLKGWEANPIRAAAFSPDGTRVAVGAEDGTVRIWMADGSDRELPVVFEPPAAIKEEGEESVPGIVALWFSRPDGTHVLTRWDDGRVRRSMADGSDKDFPVLHAGQDARFGAEGLLLLEPLESGAGLRNVDGVQLQQAIRAATRICLEPSFRRIDLGESEPEARKRYEACQARASEALQAE